MRFRCRALITVGLFCCLVFAVTLLHTGQSPWSTRISEVGILGVAYAQDQADGASVSSFEIEPLYRAARLTWRARVSGDGPVTFEIYRSMTTPEGPYALVTSIQSRPGKKKYRYVDKELPVEENYYYKIEIPSTEESFGPLQVRPPFSLPST